MVSSRVLRSTRVDREIEYDYDFYCPHCFTTYAEDKGYNLGSRGVFFRFKKSPSLIGIIILWALFTIGFIINFFFPIGYVLWVGSIIAMIVLKITADKNYKKYLGAQQITKTPVAVQPSKKKVEVKEKVVVKEKGNFCPACGANNPSGSKFCNSCGNIL